MRQRNVLGLALALVVGATPAAADTVLVSRQSPSLGGSAGDLDSIGPSLSRDGGLVAFASDARNLSDADTEPPGAPQSGRSDVFVHDRGTGETTLVSPGPESYVPAMAAGGRFVVFVSAPGPHEPGTVHVRDLRTGTLEVVGRRSTTIGYAYPQAPPAISGDGRFVAHETNGRSALRVFDRRTDRGRIFARVGSGRFSGLSISLDGRVIAFSRLRSTARGDEVSVYRYNRRTRRRRLLSRYVTGCCLIGSGTYGTAVSRTGRHVAYVSRGRVLVHDARSGRRRSLGGGTDPSISADGRTIAFTRDPAEGYARVMLRRGRRGGPRVAVGRASSGRLSADGRWLGFVEASRDPSQVYVADLGR